MKERERKGGREREREEGREGETDKETIAKTCTMQYKEPHLDTIKHLLVYPFTSSL